MRPVLLWGPVIIVMALIFFVSSKSDPGAPPGRISDKAAHVIAYAALGASLVRALAGGRHSAMTVGRIGVAALIATLYGVTDEIHQMFVPNRTPDVLDLVADACGGISGALFLAVAARLANTISPSRRTS